VPRAASSMASWLITAKLFIHGAKPRAGRPPLRLSQFLGQEAQAGRHARAAASLVIALNRCCSLLMLAPIQTAPSHDKSSARNLDAPQLQRRRQLSRPGASRSPSDSMTAANPLWFHPSFLCGLRSGNKCGSPTAFVHPRSHHVNDIPTGRKLWGAHRSTTVHGPPAYTIRCTSPDARFPASLRAS
jgi:hypothetical protein